MLILRLTASNLINPRAKRSWRNKLAFCQKWTTTSWVTSAGMNHYNSVKKDCTDNSKSCEMLPCMTYGHVCYCRFLFEVQQNSKVNKMSVENLATVMGVNLFKPQVEDAISMMKGQLSSMPWIKHYPPVYIHGLRLLLYLITYLSCLNWKNLHLTNHKTMLLSSNT